jgi:hypothetical protein
VKPRNARIWHRPLNQNRPKPVPVRARTPPSAFLFLQTKLSKSKPTSPHKTTDTKTPNLSARHPNPHSPMIRSRRNTPDRQICQRRASVRADIAIAFGQVNSLREDFSEIRHETVARLSPDMGILVLCASSGLADARTSPCGTRGGTSRRGIHRRRQCPTQATVFLPLTPSPGPRRRVDAPCPERQGLQRAASAPAAAGCRRKVRLVDPWQHILRDPGRARPAPL